MILDDGSLVCLGMGLGERHTEIMFVSMSSVIVFCKGNFAGNSRRVA